MEITAGTPKTMRVRIVSQEEEVFSGEASMLLCRSEGGDLGIYPGHSQLLSLMRPGAVRIKIPEGEEFLLYVSGGILEVQPSMVLILADVIERPQDVDQFAAEEAIEAARAFLATKGAGDSSGNSEESAIQYYQAQQNLAEASAKLRVLGLANA